MPERTLTVLTFRDEAGLLHPAVALVRATVSRRTFLLAVSDRPRLLVLEEHPGGAVQPVRDRKVAAIVEEAIRAASGGAAETALVFEATGPGGERGRYAATRAVAHGGEPYLVATAIPGGGTHVFRAPRTPPGSGPEAPPPPAAVADEALVRRILDLAAAAERPAARLAVLTLPGGERRELDLVKDVRVGGAAYSIGVDRSEGSRAYVLRIGTGGGLSPVTDPAEVDRIRLAIADRRSSPAAG